MGRGARFRPAGRGAPGGPGRAGSTPPHRPHPPRARPPDRDHGAFARAALLGARVPRGSEARRAPGARRGLRPIRPRAAAGVRCRRGEPGGRYLGHLHARRDPPRAGARLPAVLSERRRGPQPRRHRPSWRSCRELHQRRQGRIRPWCMGDDGPVPVRRVGPGAARRADGVLDRRALAPAAAPRIGARFWRDPRPAGSEGSSLSAAAPAGARTGAGPARRADGHPTQLRELGRPRRQSPAIRDAVRP